MKREIPLPVLIRGHCTCFACPRALFPVAVCQSPTCPATFVIQRTSPSHRTNSSETDNQDRQPGGPLDPSPLRLICPRISGHCCMLAIHLLSCILRRKSAHAFQAFGNFFYQRVSGSNLYRPLQLGVFRLSIPITCAGPAPRPLPGRPLSSRMNYGNQTVLAKHTTRLLRWASSALGVRFLTGRVWFLINFPFRILPLLLSLLVQCM